MERALLWICAAVFALIAVGGLWSPLGLLEPLEVAATGNAGLVELRAMYGGMQLGLAGFFAWCALDPVRHRVGLAGATATIGGLGLVRLLGLVVTPSDVGLLYAFVVLEVGGAALGAATLARGVRP